MSIFGKIKGSIFGKKAEAAEPSAPQAAPAPQVGQATAPPPAAQAPASASPTPVPGMAPAPAAPAATSALQPSATPVDVIASLESTAKAKGSDLK